MLRIEYTNQVWLPGKKKEKEYNKFNTIFVFLFLRAL